MSWVGVLEAVHGLHRIGMSVAVALEQQAQSGLDSEPAGQWRAMRLRLADPVEAMACLAAGVRNPRERFAAECLLICLERSGADHDRVLRIALEQPQLDQGRAATLTFALALVALSSGESEEHAIERAAAAFGARRARAVRTVLEGSRVTAVPQEQSLRDAMREMRDDRLVVPLRGAAVSAFALTAAAVGTIPGSVELGLAGW